MDGDITRGTGKYRGTGIGVDVAYFYCLNIDEHALYGFLVVMLNSLWSQHQFSGWTA
jgi:hypothetical protein